MKTLFENDYSEIITYSFKLFIKSWKGVCAGFFLLLSITFIIPLLISLFVSLGLINSLTLLFFPVFTSFLFILITPFVQNSFILYLVALGLSNPISLSVVFRYSLKKYLSVFLLQIVINIITSLGFLLFIIPGVFFALKFSQSYYICLIEGLSIKDSIRQSGIIMKGNYLKVFLLYVIIIGFAVGLHYILSVLGFSNIWLSLIIIFAGFYMHVMGYSIYVFLKNKSTL